MTPDLSRYIINPGPKAAVTGLKAAVTTDSAIVTETMLNHPVSTFEYGVKCLFQRRRRGIAKRHIFRLIKMFVIFRSSMIYLCCCEGTTQILRWSMSTLEDRSTLPCFLEFGLGKPLLRLDRFTPRLSALVHNVGSRVSQVPWPAAQIQSRGAGDTLETG